MARSVGLDISKWDPSEVRGLFGDAGLLAIAGLGVWKFPVADVIKAVSAAVEAWIATRRAEADAAKALAEERRAQAELREAEAKQLQEQAAALARLTHGRRADDA